MHSNSKPNEGEDKRRPSDEFAQRLIELRKDLAKAIAEAIPAEDIIEAQLDSGNEEENFYSIEDFRVSVSNLLNSHYQGICLPECDHVRIWHKDDGYGTAYPLFVLLVEDLLRILRAVEDKENRGGEPYA